MINIICVVCCILTGFAVGKFIEKTVGDKDKFYNDLMLYISELKENVSGRQLELAKFNQEFAKKSSRYFSDFIESGRICVKLSKVQKRNILTFFENLDCSSSQVLIEHINHCSAVLADDAKYVAQNEIAKASIYSKLGMLLGAMLGILLI